MECIACGQQTHSPLVRGGALLCATCREAGDTADLRDRIAELEAQRDRLALALREFDGAGHICLGGKCRWCFAASVLAELEEKR